MKHLSGFLLLALATQALTQLSPHERALFAPYVEVGEIANPEVGSKR